VAYWGSASLGDQPSNRIATIKPELVEPILVAGLVPENPEIVGPFWSRGLEGELFERAAPFLKVRAGRS
jgi:hypothetical protein